MKLISTLRKMYTRVRLLVREVQARGDGICQPGRALRAVFFCSQQDSGGSGYLRAHVVAKELREHGWRTVIPHAALTLTQRLRIVNAEQPDVILLQQARHPFNRPRYYKGIPCVFDLDDADILDPKCTTDVIEAASESQAVVAGSRYVSEQLKPYNKDISIIWTCYDRNIKPNVSPQENRKPIVAWASLFPSRFPSEAKMIQSAMIDLARRVPFTFRLYGVRDRWRVRDPEFARRYIAPIEAAGAKIEMVPLLKYSQFVKSLETVAIGLQPVSIESDHSKGRSFGKILAYLAAGVAVVASDAVDHPLFFRNSVNGMLVGNDPLEWASACEKLLTDPLLRSNIARHGRNDLQNRLTFRTAANLLDPILRRAIGKRSL